LGARRTGMGCFRADTAVSLSGLAAVDVPFGFVCVRSAPAVAERVRCGRCGNTIPVDDIRSGKAADLHGVRLCAACIAELEAQDTVSDEVTNDDLLRELRNITRALTYEKFSYWHVLGAIGQAMALGTLLVSALRGIEALPGGLLYAVFFQLLALTFFILGRR